MNYLKGKVVSGAVLAVYLAPFFRVNLEMRYRRLSVLAGRIFAN